MFFLEEDQIPSSSPCGGSAESVNEDLEEEEDEDEEELNRHQCLQCDKNFLTYDQ